MRQTITIVLVVTLIVSGIGAQAYADETQSSPLEAAHSYPQPSVPSATSPSDGHRTQADDRAANLTGQLSAGDDSKRNDFEKRYVGKTRQLRQTARTADSEWGKLIAHRSIAINARVAITHREAENGKLTERDIRREADRLRNELDSFEKQTSYRANSPTQAVVLVGEIERSLTSADGWLEQIPSILARDDLSKSQRIAYAAGSLEGARGNLNDARQLHQQYQPELQGGTDQEATLDDRYTKIHESVRNRVESASYSDDVYASKMVRKANGYLNRSETRYEDGYKAAAVFDLLRAQQFMNAAEVTADDAVPGSNNVTGDDAGYASEQKVYEAKKDAVQSLNATLDGTNNRVVLLLLDQAERQIVGGDEDVRWALEHPDSEAQQKAYVRYVVARSLAETAEDTAGLLEASSNN